MRRRSGALLWWKDAEAFGTNGGDPNNGLGKQLDLRGASLTRPKPLRLQVCTAGKVKLILSFADDSALLEWEAAIRRALDANMQERKLDLV